MKNSKLNRVLHLLSYLIIVGVSFIGLLSCTEEESQLIPGKDQGTITFELAQTTPFGVASLEQISTIKVILEKEGELIELPSMKLYGSENFISTHPYIIDRGAYKVSSYRAFGSDANLLLDITELPILVSFEIEPGDAKAVALPIGVKEVPTGSNLRNTLYALCKEVFGDNRDLWPATWQDSTELINFKGVEFVLDDYDQPSFILGLTLGSDFAPMKRLPDLLHNLVTLTSLTIRDNELDQLPGNFARTNLEVLNIINTNLSTLPTNFANMDMLAGLYLEGNKFTELPAQLFELPALNFLYVNREPVTSISIDLGKLSNLVALTLSGLQISALPDCFNRFTALTELTISNNAKLATLPASIATSTRLRTVNADGCGFTAIPEVLYSSKFSDLNLADNKITAIDGAKAANWTLLSSLNLNRNKLTSFPTVAIPNLGMLALVDCGLTRVDVNISQMPMLSESYLFFTQAQWEAIFGSSLR